MTTKFRILTIDGGGALVSAAILDALQLRLKTKLSDWFDLIVGVSSGGFISLALANRDRHASLLSFVSQSFSDHEAFQTEVAKLKSISLNQLKPDVVIVCYDLQSRDRYLFRSKHLDGPIKFPDFRLDVVASACCAEPNQGLKPVELEGERGRKLILVDGSTLFNNPSQLALREFERLYKLSLGEPKVDLVSVGSGRVMMQVSGDHPYYPPSQILLTMAASGNMMTEEKLSVDNCNVIRLDLDVEPEFKSFWTRTVPSDPVRALVEKKIGGRISEAAEKLALGI